MKWTIIYDNLAVVRGKGEEEFKNALSDGIQFIVWENGEIFCDNDYYWYIDGLKDQTNEIGPLLRRLGIKYGRTTSISVFEEARLLAKEELGKYVK